MYEDQDDGGFLSSGLSTTELPDLTEIHPNEFENITLEEAKKLIAKDKYPPIFIDCRQKIKEFQENNSREYDLGLWNSERSSLAIEFKKTIIEQCEDILGVEYWQSPSEWYSLISPYFSFYSSGRTFLQGNLADASDMRLIAFSHQECENMPERRALSNEKIKILKLGTVAQEDGTPFSQLRKNEKDSEDVIEF